MKVGKYSLGGAGKVGKIKLYVYDTRDLPYIHGTVHHEVVEH